MMPALVREGRLTGFAMRYLGRLVAYLAVFFITFSLGYTLLLRWVPVTLTPLKAIDPAGRFGHLPEHRLVLDDARAGHQQEHPAVEMPQVGNMAQNFSGIHGSESFLTE